MKAIRLQKKFSALYLQPNLITSFYFYQLLTYFNSLKIMSRELHYEKEKY
jgi:hypothetical protein